MMQTIKITTNNKISVINIDLNNYKEINKEIKCDISEVVKTRFMWDFFGQPVLMLVDEEGILKNLKLNSVGSYMYGTHLHGHPIVGDIIFAVPDGECLAGFENAKKIKKHLLVYFNFLQEA